MSSSDSNIEPKKRRFQFRNKTSDELAEEWAEKSVVIPRMPFFYINVYQFCAPIFVIMIIDFLIYYLYEIFTIEIIWQIIILPAIFIIDYFMYI